MSTRRERISEANLALVAAINNLKSSGGDNAALSTTNKASLVAAINEVLGVANAAASSGGASIDDALTNNVNAWSSNKIDTFVTASIAAALEGEDLSDLAAEITALAQADNGLVSATSNQSFTAAEQTIARTNITAANSTEVGDTDFNFAAEIAANLT